MQTWDRSGHSLLGRGYHEKLILEMDRILLQSGLFAAEVNRIKRTLLDDILSPQNTYWETEEKIVAEMERILAQAHPCLSQKDLIALEARKEQFRLPYSHGIKTNVKAGNE